MKRRKAKRRFFPDQTRKFIRGYTSPMNTYPNNSIESATGISTSTDDTLSMISTPWSTESWNSDTDNSNTLNYLITWRNPHPSSISSIRPKSSTSYAPPSPDLRSSASQITLTLMPAVLNTPTASRFLPTIRDSSCDSGRSSWTLQSFTSHGLSPHELTVKYPWSPGTLSTDLTDGYPLTETLRSRKGSRETVNSSAKDYKLTPMNFVQDPIDYNPLLDWTLVKQNGIPDYNRQWQGSYQCTESTGLIQ